MDEPDVESTESTYPVPEAVIAGHPGVLAAVAAAILAVLLFWRKKAVRPQRPTPPIQ